MLKRKYLEFESIDREIIKNNNNIINDESYIDDFNEENEYDNYSGNEVYVLVEEFECPLKKENELIMFQNSIKELKKNEINYNYIVSTLNKIDKQKFNDIMSISINKTSDNLELRRKIVKIKNIKKVENTEINDINEHSEENHENDNIYFDY